MSRNRSFSRFNKGRSFSYSSRFSRRPSRNGSRIDHSLLVKKSNGQGVQETFVPVHSFNDFEISRELKQNIYNLGYKDPTPIQDKTIPLIIQGRDVVGLANTGTGKTAAFLVPLINKLFNDRTQKVLIVAPTRELAVQIQKDAQNISRGMNILSVLCIGGVGIFRQIEGLRRDPNIVIGTPGRLKDLKNRNKLNIASFNNIVLDEVDRMLDMGFIHDMRFIISHLPSIRQSLFFSSTLSRDAQEIMDKFLRNPVTVSVKVQETAENVDQDIIKTNGQAKFDVLHKLLSQEEFRKVLVFGRTKHGVEKLANQLSERGFAVASLHGNKNQNQRQKALNQFRSDEVSVLLATDVASRGLDIPNVTHVINYELPESYEDYIHRIGRTGRANKKGTALSFVD